MRMWWLASEDDVVHHDHFVQWFLDQWFLDQWFLDQPHHERHALRRACLNQLANAARLRHAAAP